MGLFQFLFGPPEDPTKAPPPETDEKRAHLIQGNWRRITEYQTPGPHMIAAAKQTIHGSWYVKILQRHGFTQARQVFWLMQNEYDIRTIEQPEETAKLYAVVKDPAQILYMTEPAERLQAALIEPLCKLAESYRSNDDFSPRNAEVIEVLRRLQYLRNPTDEVQAQVIKSMNELISLSCCEKENIPVLETAIAEILRTNGEPSA